MLCDAQYTHLDIQCPFKAHERSHPQIYLTPYNAEVVGVIDTSNDTYSSIPAPQTKATDSRFWTAIAMESKVYFFPDSESIIAVLQVPTPSPTAAPTSAPTTAAPTSAPTSAPTPVPTTGWESRFMFWLWITEYLSGMGKMFGL
jgi:hypothetical protein